MASQVGISPDSSGVQDVQCPTDLYTAMERDGIEFVFAMFVDLHGKPCAKLVPAAAIDDLLANGAGFAGYAAGAIGQDPSSPDLIAMPDVRSYTPAPWQPGLAILQCDPYCEGEPWPYAPRVILRKQIEKLSEQGLLLSIGAEVEYFLVRRDGSGAVMVADSQDTSNTPCYDARALSRMYEHLTSVSTYMNALGWSNYANDHEDANGQFEQNFRYADALTTADRIIAFRYMLHSVAARSDMLATFMPKPFAGLTGNGLHMHLSLWDLEGHELFCDVNDARGLGMSKLGYSFIAGLLQHSQALTAMTCPTVNSYKRLASAPTASGAPWSPALASYGGNDRTHMLRIPGPGRVENRLVDGAANPYLAIAAQIAAGMHGIEQSLDPGSPYNQAQSERGAPEFGKQTTPVPLPATLWHALDYLEKDATLRDGLGKTPTGDYIDYFISVKQSELRDYHAAVSPWEIERYLSSI